MRRFVEKHPRHEHGKHRYRAETFGVDPASERIVRAPGDNPCSQAGNGQVVKDATQSAGREHIALLLQIARGIEELHAQLIGHAPPAFGRDTSRPAGVTSWWMLITSVLNRTPSAGR